MRGGLSNLFQAFGSGPNSQGQHGILKDRAAGLDEGIDRTERLVDLAYGARSADARLFAESGGGNHAYGQRET
jgi:hypothetical protein